MPAPAQHPRLHHLQKGRTYIVHNVIAISNLNRHTSPFACVNIWVSVNRWPSLALWTGNLSIFSDFNMASFPEEDLKVILCNRWGFDQSAFALKPLPSYEDANWRLKWIKSDSKNIIKPDYVVKVTARESQVELEMQHGLIRRLPPALAPHPLKSVRSTKIWYYTLTRV